MKLSACLFGLFVAVAAAGKHQHQQQHDACDDGHATPAPTTMSPPVVPTASPLPSTPATKEPTPAPTTREPTKAPPSSKPSQTPSLAPTPTPSQRPTPKPTSHPSQQPTSTPSQKPTSTPSQKPTSTPSQKPTPTPSQTPTPTPTTTATAAPGTLSPAIPMPDNEFDENKPYDWFDNCKGEIRSHPEDLKDDADCRESFWYLRDDDARWHACFKCPTNYAFDLEKSPYVMCDGLPICGRFDWFVDVTPKQLKCLYENNGNQTTHEACGVF